MGAYLACWQRGLSKWKSCDEPMKGLLESMDENRRLVLFISLFCGLTILENMMYCFLREKVRIDRSLYLGNERKWGGKGSIRLLD